MAATDVTIRIRAIDNASRSIQSVQRSLSGLSRSASVNGAPMGAALAQRGAQVRGAASSMMAPLGLSAGFIGGAGAALAFKNTITSAADFESQLTAIQKKAGTTAEETKRLGQEALALATSGEVAVPIEEVMSAMERGAAAGLPLDELREFAKLSAMAADAFEMSAEEVGNAAAGFKTTMGIPIEEMQKYFGLINTLADSGIADERDLINFLDRAGANLKLFGLSAEQAAAYASTLSNIKMAPEVGARMMNTLTSKLLSPGSKKADAALKSIVGNVDAFQALLKSDANAALEQFLVKVGELDKFEAAEYLTGFMGQGFADEVLRLAAAYDELQRNQKIAADSASWEDSLPNTYKLKLDDFWSQWQLVKNELARLSIDLGTLTMPSLKVALEEAISLVKQIDQGLQQFKADIDMQSLNEAQKAIGELGSAIGALMTMGTEEGTGIERFFGRLAALVNTVTGGVETVRELAQEFGLVEEDTPDQGPGAAARELLREGAKVSPPLAGIENALEAGQKESRDPVANYEAEQDRNRSLDSFLDGPVDINGPSPDELGLPEQQQRPRDAKTGRLKAPPPPPEMPNYFFTESGLTEAPPTIPVPTPRPPDFEGARFGGVLDVDATASLAGIEALEQALAGVAGTTTGTVDVDIGPAMAKLQRVKALQDAIRGGGAGSGDGNNYRQNRTSQFAPVTPGGGI